MTTSTMLCLPTLCSSSIAILTRVIQTYLVNLKIDFFHDLRAEDSSVMTSNFDFKSLSWLHKQLKKQIDIKHPADTKQCDKQVKINILCQYRLCLSRNKERT